MKKYISIEEYFRKQTISKKNNNNLKIVRYIFGLLCIIIILFSLYIIFKWSFDNYKIHRINKNISQNINSYQNNNPGQLVNEPYNKKSNYYYYVTFPFYQADFSNLLEINNDTVGFIKVPNTIINYPIVQTNNNEYYLTHSFDKKKNKAGCLFMDYRSSIDPLGDNTIIYGHRRIDGTLFGSLRNVLTSTWQNNKDNYIIYFSTLKENMLFQIFSIYTIEKESYYITTYFRNSLEKQTWLDTIQKRNISTMATEVDINDKILTLSTCFGDSSERLVVHAKLIKKQINEK